MPTIQSRQLILTDPARADLDDIYDQLATRGTPIAERFVNGLLTDLRQCADNGHIGAPRDTIRPGLRVRVHGKFCAYFRYDDRHWIVLRIVRGARDIGGLTFDDDA